MTFKVFTHGVHELQAAFEDVKVKVDPELGKALSAAAVPVRDDVKRRAEGYGAATVAGVHIRRRGTSVRVQQDARKTTRLHPEFGRFQQRHFFDPALAAHQDAALEASQKAMDELVNRANY